MDPPGLPDLLAVAGLTFFAKDSKLLGADFLRVRPLLQRSRLLSELLHCSFCTGFWAALFLYLVTRAHRTLPGALVFSFAGAAAAFLFDLSWRVLERYAPRDE